MARDTQTALICGTDTALGKELAQRLTERNINAVLLSPAFNSTTEGTHTNEDSIPHFEVDLREPEVVEFAARRVRRLFGPPDISINIATTENPRAFRETTPREARQLLEINYLSTYYLLWEFIEDLIESNDGQIINVTSKAAYEPGTTAPLAATHHALRGFTESLRRELPSSLATRLVIYDQIQSTTESRHQEDTTANAISRTTLAECILESIDSDAERIFIPQELEETTPR